MFRPDVVVQSPDRPEFLLVANVKSSPLRVEGPEHQLKQYMQGMACQLGLLVTPAKTRIYRETYRGDGEDSVVMLSEVDTAALLGIENVPTDHRLLDEAVVRWLERLARDAHRPVDGRLLEVVEELIAPTVLDADVKVADFR